MPIRLADIHRAILALLVCTVACAQDESATPPGSAAEFERLPPAEGACSEEVVTHVLTETVGSWRRDEMLVTGDVALTEELVAKLDPAAREKLETYHALCGAAVTYRNTEGPGVADVLMIAFDDTLNALGFFAAQRTGSAERVLLTSPAYRDDGVLHVYSLNFYFRVEVRQAHEAPLPADQYIAAGLESRLPPREELPRIIEVMPRGWVNALTVSYAPTDLLGGSPSPMAAGAERTVGGAHMRLRVIEAEDEAQAREWYTIILQRALDHGQAWEVPRLGDEAFFARDDRPALAMLEGPFLSHLTTDGSRNDAEAVMRLVGTSIRTTRPLPDSVEGACPILTPADSP